MAVAATSILLGRNLMDPTTKDGMKKNINRPEDLERLPIMNRSVDKYGVERTLFTRQVNLVVPSSSSQYGIPKQCAAEVSRIIARIWQGKPFNWFARFDNNITSRRNARLNDRGEFGIDPAWISICVSGGGLGGFHQYKINLITWASMVSFHYSNTPLAAAHRLTSVVYDEHNRTNSNLYDVLDITKPEMFKMSIRVCHVRNELHCNSTIYAFHARHMVYSTCCVNLPSGIKPRWMSWKNVNPVLVNPDPSAYQSINSLLNMGQDTKLFKTMFPDASNDLCVCCKLIMYGDLYVLEGVNQCEDPVATASVDTEEEKKDPVAAASVDTEEEKKDPAATTSKHILMCVVCAHQSNILKILASDKDLSFILYRTRHPRTLVDYIRGVQNPIAYKEYCINRVNKQPHTKCVYNDMCHVQGHYLNRESDTQYIVW